MGSVEVRITAWRRREWRWREWRYYTTSRHGGPIGWQNTHTGWSFFTFGRGTVTRDMVLYMNNAWSTLVGGEQRPFALEPVFARDTKSGVAMLTFHGEKLNPGAVIRVKPITLLPEEVTP